jgi:hypothetical protein
MNSYTYDKRYGKVNVEKNEPLHEIDGKYWNTVCGVPAIYPDQWVNSMENLEPLPKGTSGIILGDRHD